MFRYEALEEDLAGFLRTIGLDVPVELPKAKSGWRTSYAPYREVVGAALRARIESVAAEEMKLMGYRW